jgi:hypothetical protein
MPQDWFSANAPKSPVRNSAPAQPAARAADPASDDWFAANSPARPDFRTTNARDEQGRPVVSDPRARIGRAALDFVGELDSLNPRKINEAVQSAFWHPIDTAKGVLDAQDQLRLEAQELFKAGDYGNAAVKALYWLMPIVGPQLDDAGEQLNQGEIIKGLGATTDVALQTTGPTALVRAGGKLTAGTRGRTPQNPAEASAVQFAQQRDIPLDAGTATGSQFVKNVQKRAGGSWGGANTVETAQRAQGTALARVGNELAEQANQGRGAVDAVKAGENVRTALEGRITKAHGEATTAYERLRQLEAQATPETKTVGFDPKTGAKTVEDVRLAVNVGAAKDALLPVYRDLLRERELTGQLMGGKARAVKALDTLMTGPEWAPLSAVDAALGDLKALARGAEIPALRTQGQGIAAEAVKALDAQVRARAAQAGPDVLKALEQGRAATRTKYDLADVMDLVTNVEPRATFNRLTAGKDAGVTKLRELKRVAPEQVPDVARALLEDLLEKPTSEGGFKFADKAQADWQRIGPQTRSLLFKPDQIKALDDFFLLAKKIGENPNPSGTAQVLNATNLFAGIPMYALAKVLYSPKAVRMLTTGVRMSVNGSPAARTAAAAQIANALREAGVTVSATASPGDERGIERDLPAGSTNSPVPAGRTTSAGRGRR